jgi:hypothetical protein
VPIVQSETTRTVVNTTRHVKHKTSAVLADKTNFRAPNNMYFQNVLLGGEDLYSFLMFSLSIFYLLKCAKRVRQELNKQMKSSPIYNKLQHYFKLCKRLA